MICCPQRWSTVLPNHQAATGLCSQWEAINGLLPFPLVEQVGHWQSLFILLSQQIKFHPFVLCFYTIVQKHTQTPSLGTRASLSVPQIPFLTLGFINQYWLLNCLPRCVWSPPYNLDQTVLRVLPGLGSRASWPTPPVSSGWSSRQLLVSANLPVLLKGGIALRDSWTSPLAGGDKFLSIPDSFSLWFWSNIFNSGKRTYFSSIFSHYWLCELDNYLASLPPNISLCAK